MDGSSSTPLQVLFVQCTSRVHPWTSSLYYLYSTTWCGRFPMAAKLISSQVTLHYTGPFTSLITTTACNHTLMQSAHVKCCCLLLSRKRSLSIPLPSLTLGAAPLAQVSSYKYLGVLITSSLMWSSHITNIRFCNKTRRLVGIFYRRFYKHSSPDMMLRMYSSFIRSNLECAMAAWDSFLETLFELIENI